MSEASLTCAHFVGLLSRRQPDTTRHAVGRLVNRCSIAVLFFFFFLYHRVSLDKVRIEIIVGKEGTERAHVSRLRRQRLRDNLRRTTSSRSLTGETCERTKEARNELEVGISAPLDQLPVVRGSRFAIRARVYTCRNRVSSLITTNSSNLIIPLANNNFQRDLSSVISSLRISTSNNRPPLLPFSSPSTSPFGPVNISVPYDPFSLRRSTRATRPRAIAPVRTLDKNRHSYSTKR